MILVSVTCWCSQEAGGDSSSNDYCYRCCGGSGGAPGVTAAPAEAALYSCVLTDKCTCLLDGYKADNRPHFPLPRYNIYILFCCCGSRLVSKMPFSPPSWCLTTPLIKGLSLEIIKGGVEIECINLETKANPAVPYILVGRQEDAVDVHTEHPSCSRVHAALVHGNDALPAPQSPCELHLIDLGSTHGTFVNKSLLPKQTYQALNIGDVIRFGASMRLYVLSGPDDLMPAEYDSTNLQNLRTKSEKRDMEARNAIDMETAPSFATWGMGEDAVEEDDVESSDDGEEELPDYLKTDAERKKAARKKRASQALQETEISSKDSKMFETLQRRRAKIENLYIEIERIMAKEGNQGGLSSGQQNQIDRNRQRIEELEGQVDSIENAIRAKNKQRDTGKIGEDGNITGKKRTSGSDIDESFYDRTKGEKALKNKKEVRLRRFGTPTVGFDAKQSKKTSTTSAMTCDELGRKELDLLNQIETLEGNAQDLDRNRKSVLSELESAESGPDPVDRVVLEAQVASLGSEIERLKQQIDSVKASLTRVKVLKEIAKPSLPELIQKTPPQNLEEELKPPSHVQKDEMETLILPSMNDSLDILKAKSDTSCIEAGYVNESPARKARSSTIKNAEVLKLVTSSDRAAGENISDIPSHEALKLIGPLRPENPAEGDEKYKGRVDAAGDIAEKVSTWVPPTNQSGDGRTALNAKFGY